MADAVRPVTMMISDRPETTASSMTYWIIGLSTSGRISFGAPWSRGGTAIRARRRERPPCALSCSSLISDSGEGVYFPSESLDPHTLKALARGH